MRFQTSIKRYSNVLTDIILLSCTFPIQQNLDHLCKVAQKKPQQQISSRDNRWEGETEYHGNKLTTNAWHHYRRRETYINLQTNIMTELTSQSQSVDGTCPNKTRHNKFASKIYPDDVNKYFKYPEQYFDVEEINYILSKIGQLNSLPL